MNETDPKAILTLAGVILDDLAKSAASQIEKISALKVAAGAIDEALNAQTRAVVVSNIIRGSAPK